MRLPWPLIVRRKPDGPLVCEPRGPSRGQRALLRLLRSARNLPRGDRRNRDRSARVREDVVVLKRRASAFAGTDLDLVLRPHTIAVAGSPRAQWSPRPVTTRPIGAIETGYSCHPEQGSDSEPAGPSHAVQREEEQEAALAPRRDSSQCQAAYRRVDELMTVWGRVVPGRASDADARPLCVCAHA
jgi:hypothetical protein